jgi:hypothetical protein
MNLVKTTPPCCKSSILTLTKLSKTLRMKWIYRGFYFPCWQSVVV